MACMMYDAPSCVEVVAVAALDPQARVIETIGRFGGVGNAVGEAEGCGDAALCGADDRPQLAMVRATSRSITVERIWPRASWRPPRAVWQARATKGVIRCLAASLFVCRQAPGLAPEATSSA